MALKVVKSSFESEEAVQRLEYEAQILARLRHPGIAQIYDAGSYDDRGTLAPFFAMEYIPNARPITEYASPENRWTVASGSSSFCRSATRSTTGINAASFTGT